MEGLSEILTVFGGTSPLVALVAWHMWNMQKTISQLAAHDATVTEALHALDKRLAVIESHITGIVTGNPAAHSKRR